jgi:hypothetical protein
MATSVRERSRRRAVAAGTGGLVAGAAFATLQVLEQTIGAWHPKAWVSALIVLAAFFAGLAAARVKTRQVSSEEFEARERHLSELLGTWPAPLVANADPTRLGVFPASRQLQETPYVPRTIDEELREAMVSKAVVLVIGDARAGASRTALEAARDAWGDAVLLAPRAAGCLRELTVLDPPLELGEHRALLWLDGLDRFSEALDWEAIDTLSKLGEHVIVVATLRRVHWEAWQASDGEQGEAARAVVAYARVFELPTALDAEEAVAARELYPGIEFPAGLGEALASDGRESARPPTHPSEAGAYEEPDPTPRLLLDRRFMMAALATFAALVALGLVLDLSGLKTASISEQLASDEREGSLHARHAAIVMQADMHGSGVKSWVILFRDNASPATHSDELEIYDEHGESLKRALRFKPVGTAAKFTLRATTDVDFDGAPEIVGGLGFADENIGRGAMVPFAIDWNTAHERYAVVPLGQEEPMLSRRQIHAAERRKPALSRRIVETDREAHAMRKTIEISEAQYRRLYMANAVFSDPSDHLRLEGHRVQDFAVTGVPHRLLLGWFMRPWFGKDPATFEVETAILDSHTGAPHLTSCTLSELGGPMLLAIRKDREPNKVFEEEYAHIAHGRACLP